MTQAAPGVDQVRERYDRDNADHLRREPLEHLGAEGFEIERLERAKRGIVERVAARKPPG